jgi:hypothetical protein
LHLSENLPVSGERASLCYVTSARATLSVSLLLLAGCHARQTGPDENYEKGSRIYQQLYATQLDDAYGDPKMKEAEGLLKKVDPLSIDSESAKRMLASIDSGRALLAKQRAARNQMAATAAASIASQPRFDPVKIIAASAPPDAGVVDPFGPGASVADLNATSGGCLTAGEPYREQGTGATGTVYRVGKSPQCAERLPGFVGEAVLVSDGKIYRRLPDPRSTNSPAPLGAPAAGTAASAANADAGPVRVAAKPPVVQPADGSPDGGGESRIYIPGMPIPEGMAPPAPPPDPQQQ